MTDAPAQSRETSRDAEARAFYNAAPQRILRTTIILGVVVAALALIRYSLAVAIPVGLGALLGALNFAWLARSTGALLGRVAALSRSGEPGVRIPRGGGAVARFVLRYVLIGVAAYGIFKSSVFSILGFFVGLSLPVAALMLEAVYELGTAYRRGL